MMEVDDTKRLLDAAAQVAERIEGGVFGAVLLVAVYNDGRGVKFWAFGDDKVTDELSDGLQAILPLPACEKYSKQIDDGA